MYKLDISRHQLQFKIPARTSRGSYTTHDMIVIRLEDEQGNVGYGECAPLPDLSSDGNSYNDISKIKEIIYDYLENIEKLERLENIEQMLNFPALKFALESAFLNASRPAEFFSTPFAKGEAGIPINGLIWMSDYDNMCHQIEHKLADGFRCIKLKIGAINWSEELALLKMIRQRFSANELTLRVDANGAFPIQDAMRKLEELASFDTHSIEQPIRQGNRQEMAFLCQNSPVPIALDEELIGLYTKEERINLLETIKPQYIVVKPTLHGGLFGAEEWVTLARERNIGSWLTSALESNIGLRSIALLAAYLYGPNFAQSSVEGSKTEILYQGLGTGQLFVENTPSTLHLIKDELYL